MVARVVVSKHSAEAVGFEPRLNFLVEGRLIIVGSRALGALECRTAPVVSVVQV